MRTLLVASIIVAVALGLVAVYVLRNPDIPNELATVTQNAKSTIHLRADLAVSVEVADTADKRMKGLSGRDPLPENTGLLFIFEEDGYPAIWMKDMLFAIDIIWIDAQGQIVSIAPGVTPETYPQTFKPAQAARYVLEMKAGYVEARNVQAGDMTDVAKKFPPNR